MDVKISIEPDPVRRNEVVTITVSTPGGGDPSGLLMRIVSAQGSLTMRAPRKLDAYGAPKPGEPGAYECKIHTIKFESGEYLVDVVPGSTFSSSDVVSKKFTVVPPRTIVSGRR